MYFSHTTVVCVRSSLFNAYSIQFVILIVPPPHYTSDVQQLHRDLPPTTLYAYGTSKETASSPGPTLIAQKNHKTVIRWTNHIDDISLCASKELCLPVDKTLNLANPDRGVPNGVLSHPATLSFLSLRPECAIPRAIHGSLDYALEEDLMFC